MLCGSLGSDSWSQPGLLLSLAPSGLLCPLGGFLLALVAAEDVVGRVVDDRRAERGDVSRPLHVDAPRLVGMRLGPVDVGPGSRVEDDLGIDGERRRDVELLARARVGVRKRLAQRGAELAARAGDQETASRSERMGDSVLQRCATRESFQGNSCSSGSSRSYSSVTW